MFITDYKNCRFRLIKPKEDYFGIPEFCSNDGSDWIDCPAYDSCKYYKPKSKLKPIRTIRCL